MDENNFFHTFDKIDDEFIEEAAGNGAVKPDFANPPPKSRKPVFAILGAAACFALVFSIGMAVKNNTGIEITQPPVNSAETTSETASETSTEEPETTPAETEPEGVEMTDKNGLSFTLVGEPMSSDKLVDFDYEKTYREMQNSCSENMNLSKLFSQLENEGKGEIREIYCRAEALRYLISDEFRYPPDFERTTAIENPARILYGPSEKVKFDPQKSSIEDFFAEHGYIPELVGGTGVDETDTYKNTYSETGITYDSFYNAFLKVFTQEAADKTIEFLKPAICPVSYNGELWIYPATYGAQDGIVYYEYEIVKNTDTEVEFNEIRYSSWGANFAYYEYYPWLKDLYGTSKYRNRFVKTDEGWRAEEVATMFGSTLNGFDGEFDIQGCRAEKLDDAIMKKYLYPENPALLKEPWTEEKVNEAFELLKSDMMQSEEAYYFNPIELSETYMARCFCDIDGDGSTELVLSAGKYNKIGIFKIDESGYIRLLSELDFNGGWRWSGGFFLSEIPDYPEERAGSKLSEDIFNKRQLTIFTDDSGNLYVITMITDDNTLELLYQVHKILLSEEDIVPLYIWGRLGSWDNEVYDGTIKYKTYDFDETGHIKNNEYGVPYFHEVSKQELEELLSRLKPVE